MNSIDVTIIRDLPYAAQSEAQKLDIYMLSKRGKACPVIMWMHPGGFHEGDKDGSAIAPLAIVNMIKLVQPMLERGYAVVSINYRLSHEAIFPPRITTVDAFGQVGSMVRALALQRMRSDVNIPFLID